MMQIKRLHTMLPIIMVVCLAMVLSVTGAANAQGIPKAQIGKAAPEFSLYDTQGVLRSLSDFKGKIVVLEWTNHECPYVRKHYDSKNMQNLQKEARAAGVAWLTINSSGPGKQGYTEAVEARKVMQEEGSNEDLRLLDPEGTVGRLYDARTTPHMYIIDAQGMLVYAGGIDDNPSPRVETVATARNYVREALAALEKGEPIKAARTQPYGCTVHYKS